MQLRLLRKRVYCVHLCKGSDCTEFQCDNGKCIDDDLKCDRVDHCFDNSDETFCCKYLSVFLVISAMLHIKNTVLLSKGSPCHCLIVDIIFDVVITRKWNPVSEYKFWPSDLHSNCRFCQSSKEFFGELLSQCFKSLDSLSVAQPTGSYDSYPWVMTVFLSMYYVSQERRSGCVGIFAIVHAVLLADIVHSKYCIYLLIYLLTLLLSQKHW